MDKNENPREHASWSICEHTGQLERNGVCPVHKGDACLITVVWRGVERIRAIEDEHIADKEHCAHLLASARAEAELLRVENDQLRDKLAREEITTSILGDALEQAALDLNGVAVDGNEETRKHVEEVALPRVDNALRYWAG